MPDHPHDDWSSAGPRGKHKHWAAANVIPEPALSPNFSLATLPGPAMASIFHNSDYVTAHRLAQTCHACAREYNYYTSTSAFSAKCCQEWLPQFEKCEPDNRSCTKDYRFTWTEDSADGLQHIYAMSHQPGCLRKMWRAAIPGNIQPDLSALAFDTARTYWGDKPQLTVKVDLFLYSCSRLQLSMLWLLQPFLETAAAAMADKINAFASYHIEFEFEVYRPAQENQWQLINSRSIVIVPKGSKTHEHCYDFVSETSCESRYYDALLEDREKVAVTGPWCKELYDTKGSNWKFPLGTSGNRMVPGDELTDLGFDFEEYACVSNDAGSWLEQEAVDLACKPFTCEADCDSEYQRHYAKKQRQTRGKSRKSWQQKMHNQVSRTGKKQQLQPLLRHFDTQVVAY